MDTKQPNYTKAIALDRAHPYPSAQKALNSAITTTIGLGLFGGLCYATCCGCFAIILAKRALVNVSKGDFETASRFVCASFACSIGGVILFALTCAVLVISFVAYIRMVYLSE
ncbi:hypothetical protein GBAR_LOCUS16870 [Geodia barretti]|uniref:Uncharacterized protein n=1 Tax=Geodia barretti TaxID=519541 RepID=A0AA35SHJ6_GEOBA|nr:hypothetical protein GBAR_LOCUS16870 [Geodia barretti]